MSSGAGVGVGVCKRAGVGGRRVAGGRVGAGVGVGVGAGVCAYLRAWLWALASVHLGVGLGFCRVGGCVGVMFLSFFFLHFLEFLVYVFKTKYSQEIKQNS